MNPQPSAPTPGTPRRRSFWARLGRDALIALAVVLGIGLWQARGMLPTTETAPPFDNLVLDTGTRLSLADLNDKTAVLYFFAPWCTVCDVSISNLQTLSRLAKADDRAFVVVALDFETVDSVRAFIKDNEIDLPVVLGDATVRDAYRISAYPSYYVLGKGGVVRHASVGYSTLIGLWWRLLLA